jgi:hypothetical protein
MLHVTFTTPHTINEKNSLTNLILTKDNVTLFRVHSGIVAFGKRASQLIHDRATSQINSNIIDLSDLNIIDLSDLNDVNATDIKYVLEYIYSGTVPTLNDIEKKVFGITIERQSTVDHVLRIYQTSKQLKIHTLTSILSANLLEYVRMNPQLKSILSQPETVQKLCLTIKEIIEAQKLALEYLTKSYIGCNNVKDNERKIIRSALTSNPSHSLKRLVQKTRTRRLSQIKMKLAVRGVEMKAVIEYNEEDESENENDDDDVEMQKAIVVQTFEADKNSQTCISVKEGEFVDVIFYDESSGWAGILRMNGKKGYVPITYIVLQKLPSSNETKTTSLLKADKKELPDSKSNETKKHERKDKKNKKDKKLPPPKRFTPKRKSNLAKDKKELPIPLGLSSKGSTSTSPPGLSRPGRRRSLRMSPEQSDDGSTNNVVSKTFRKSFVKYR